MILPSNYPVVMSLVDDVHPRELHAGVITLSQFCDQDFD